MTTKNPCRLRGFTLVEMLVVIAIIGVLAAILVPTLYRVVIKARQNRIAQELNQLHLAIEAYKQKFGDYPPDFTTLTSLNDFNVVPGAQPHLVVRHIRKAFPRHTYTLGNTGTLAQCFIINGNFVQPDPAEALVLWLSQVRDDPRQPLTSGNQIKLFPFDEKRLVDPAPNEVDENGTPHPDGLYSYLPPDSDKPYVYFDSRVYSDVATAGMCVYKHVDVTAGTVKPLLYPYVTKRTSDPVSTTNPLTVPNPTTFQIISAGLDSDYGDVSGVTAGDATTYKIFPWNDNNRYQLGDLDNISNFSDGKIFEDFLE